MAERIDVLAVLRNAVEVTGRSLTPIERSELFKARAAVEDLIDFLRDADCNCRPETEHYAAHTCSRCELLARVGGAE